MGDLPWKRRGYFGFPEKALRTHAVVFGSSGSGKTETEYRIAYGAHKVHQRQVIMLDAKGQSRREEEQQEDNAARFVATMQAAGTQTVAVFPALYYNGWQGTPVELKNRLLSVVDFSESPFYGDVAANALDLALSGPTTPRSSAAFLANLNYTRLKEIHANDPHQYRRVLALDKQLLRQVEMRYQVFFSAMAGQLDGQLDYAGADAVYLRVRGFSLRNEAPRLGRFLVMDFVQYIAERRKPGVQTLFIIDEFNALRMREETSILFEQVRSFGGNLIISSQGYAGLGPREYAERILDACSTYILHACSDPGPVARRAGKKFFLEVTWSEGADGIPHKHIRPKYDWRIPETAVIQQEEGQAFWSHKGRSQQVQTAMVPITAEQTRAGWAEIRRQEELQRQLLEIEAQRQQEQREQQAKAQQQKGQGQPPKATKQQAAPPGPRSASDGKGQGQKQKPASSNATPPPPQLQSPPPVVNQDDDEPDEL